MSCKEKNTLQLCRIIKCQNEPWLVSAEPPREYVKHQTMEVEGDMLRDITSLP